MNEITTGQFISIGISLVSLIMVFIFKMNEKKKKKFYYIIRNRTIIEKEKIDKEIEIKYKSKKIEKLNQTDVLIFNKGSKTIKFEELGKVIGMQLEFSKKTKIFDYKIIEYNNPNVNFKCSTQANIMNLKFDYFKKENFVKLEINSNEKSEKFPILNCEFINEDQIIKFSHAKFVLSEMKIFLPLLFVTIIIVDNILNYFNISLETQVIISMLTGYFGIDIYRYFLKKKVSIRIREMILK